MAGLDRLKFNCEAVGDLCENTQARLAVKMHSQTKVEMENASLKTSVLLRTLNPPYNSLRLRAAPAL